jgi:hypothetical protein
MKRTGIGMAWTAAWFASLAHAQVPKAAEEDIRAARAIIEIPAPAQPSYFWWYVALGVFLFSLAGLILWRWLSSRRPAISAMSRALKALRALEERQAQLDDEAFAAEAADVLRAYVAVAYGIAAPQRTSEEFLQECLQRKIIADPSLEKLRGFLKACDIAKFASGSLTGLDRQDMLAQVKDMVLAPLLQAEETPSNAAA